MIIFCDVDGTISDHSHRLDFLEPYERCDCAKGAILSGCGRCQGTGRRKRKKDWDSYYARMPLDPPIAGAQRVLPRLANQPNFWLVFLTGRPERYRPQTEEWMRAHFEIPQPRPGVRGAIFTGKHSSLCMRPDGDRRPAVEFKEEVVRDLYHQLRGSRPFLFLDDDLRNTEMYSKYGVFLKAPECWGVFP